MRRSFNNLKAYPLGHYDALNIEIRATSFVISKTTDKIYTPYILGSWYITANEREIYICKKKHLVKT